MAERLRKAGAGEEFVDTPNRRVDWTRPLALRERPDGGWDVTGTVDGQPHRHFVLSPEFEAQGLDAAPAHLWASSERSSLKLPRGDDQNVGHPPRGSRTADDASEESESTDSDPSRLSIEYSASGQVPAVPDAEVPERNLYRELRAWHGVRLTSLNPYLDLVDWDHLPLTGEVGEQDGHFYLQLPVWYRVHPVWVGLWREDDPGYHDERIDLGHLLDDFRGAFAAANPEVDSSTLELKDVSHTGQNTSYTVELVHDGHHLSVELADDLVFYPAT